MECRLSIVRVFVRDFERALRFYAGTLGIPLALRSDEYGWAQLATGQAQLALERLDPASGEDALLGRFLGVISWSTVQRTAPDVSGGAPYPPATATQS